MKIKGEQITDDAIFGPVVIMRSGKKFGIYARPVWNFEDFDAAYPMPEPPPTGFNAKTGKREADPNSAAYKGMIEAYGRARWGWMVWKSVLQPSEIELEGISIEDPQSFERVEGLLKHSPENPGGLSHFEFQAVMQLFNEANMLDDEKMEANRESFLAEAAAGLHVYDSPTVDPSSTQSGQLANDGE